MRFTHNGGMDLTRKGGRRKGDVNSLYLPNFPIPFFFFFLFPKPLPPPSPPNLSSRTLCIYLIWGFMVPRKLRGGGEGRIFARRNLIKTKKPKKKKTSSFFIILKFYFHGRYLYAMRAVTSNPTILWGGIVKMGGLRKKQHNQLII